MPPFSRVLFLVGGLSLASAAMLSAYGFHGLPGKVATAKLASWEWANQLQFFHSMGLILIGLLLRYQPGGWLLRGAAVLMMVGLVLFSGSIYLEVLGAPEAVGDVAPLGGSSFMLAWVLTAIAGFRSSA